MKNKLENVYVVIKACGDQICSVAFADLEKAEILCDKYNKDACNPNSYYVQSMTIVY